MNLAVIYTRALIGISAPKVTVEVHLSNGLPGFTVVGLPETAVKESKDRVRSALLNSHFEFPQRRITVNLAPADLPKEGGRFDLAIALGILAASEQIPSSAIDQHEFIGELGLAGDLRPVRGALPAAIAGEKEQRQLIAPTGNSQELALYTQKHTYIADNLLQVCAYLHGRENLDHPSLAKASVNNSQPDLADVKGQLQARRALEIAAAGGHNLLFYGPPGTGKSMLASRLAGIMPPLEPEQAIENAIIHSISRSDVTPEWHQRPYRSPHHSASAAALVGGGSQPRPGEISLAHNGVLFLDELPEFNRHVLEVLREPLEAGHICISRANGQLTFPARFQLIAAMNPCPCGFKGDGTDRCECSSTAIDRYRNKLSGPLLDRIDMYVQVQALSITDLQQQQKGEPSAVVAERVAVSYQRQKQRQNKRNHLLVGEELKQHCQLGEQEHALLKRAATALHLSARAYERLLRVARTIADLEQSENVNQHHIKEALAYRSLQKG